MSALPKWNKEREETLTNFVGGEAPVSQSTVAEAAVTLETSARSVSSKLRKMGFDVELASSSAKKAFSDDQEAALRSLVEAGSGSNTYADIAAAFEGGAFSAKAIQGKILSMELTSHVKPTEKVAVPKTYTDAEEATFVSMVNDGKFAEEIAEALGKTVQSVRGKGLSLLRAELITAVPKQRDVVTKVDPLTELGDVSEKTVEEISVAIEKTARGVKTMLTRRGIKCADYDGQARKEKAAS